MSLITNLEDRIEIIVKGTETEDTIVIENLRELKEFISKIYRKASEEIQTITESKKESDRINRLIAGPIDICFLTIKYMDEFAILKDIQNLIYGTSLIKMFIETYGDYGDISIQIRFKN